MNISLKPNCSSNLEAKQVVISQPQIADMRTYPVLTTNEAKLLETLLESQTKGSI